MISVFIYSIVLASVCFQVAQSWDLRGHNEKDGSYEFAVEIAGMSGAQPGVFLWQKSACCSAEGHLYGSPVWMFGEGDDSAYLPGDRSKWSSYIREIANVARNRPIFLLLQGEEVVDFEFEYEQVTRFQGSIPVWEESNGARPDNQLEYIYDLKVFRINL